MGRIGKRRNPTANNSNRVPVGYKKNNSTSLSILLTTGAYKKRIRDLMKNNKSLASELERAHIQVATQKELLKNCVKDSHQMTYARAKLKDIATNIHQLVTDLDVVMGFLDVGSHLKNFKYNDQFGEDGFQQQDLRMRIADPAVSVIEEASSIEETPTTDGSTTLDAAATNPPQPDDSPFHDRIDERRESPVSGKESGNLCDFGSPGDESHLSLTPVLEIRPVVYTSRCSAGRNSRLSLKSAKTRVSENLPSKRTSQLPKKKSIESKESAMQISKDLVKIQKILSSPSKVTQVESKTNASSGDKPTMLNGFATVDPVGSAAGVDASPASEFPDKINQTLVMCEDMELTEVIPSIPKSYAVSVDTQKPRATPESNTKQDKERSSLDADTEKKAVGSFKTTDSSILPDTASSSPSKVTQVESKMNASSGDKPTMLNGFATFDPVGSAAPHPSLPHTRCPKNPSHEPDRDIYDFDSSFPKTKKVLSAENLGNATLDTKSSINYKNKKFFPNKQNCKSAVSVTNTADSFPRSCSENVDKFNSNWTKQDTVEEADASGESVDSEKELNPAGRKRVSFAALDSVYKFKRNSAVIYSDKRLTVQCTKKVVLSDSVESSASEPDEMKAEKEGKGETFTEGIKKGQHSAKKERSESSKNHALQTKKIRQCLKDKTVAEVDHNALIHSAATGGEMNLDEETEIYTFVPSKPPEVEKNDPVDCNTSMVTVRRSKNHEYSYSFDISNTDLQVIHASKLLSKPAENLETNKLLVENPPHSASLTPKSNSTESIHSSLQAKQRVKDVKLSSNGKIIKKFAVNEHNKGISCSTVTNVLKSSKFAKSGNEQNNDDEDTVTGLSSIISELMKNKKTKTNREIDGMASDRAENALPVDDILISDNGKQANCRKKSILPKDTLKKHVKRSKSPKHRMKTPLREKNGCVGSMKCNLKENEERVGLTANQVKAKAVPKRCSAFASQQNGGRESKEVKKLSSAHPDQDARTNDENLSDPRNSLNDDRPRRRSRPVCYKEPTLNKKMRRQS